MVVLRRILGIFFLFSCLAALVHCAKRGTPSGGPKDTTPPVLVRAEPENLTVNFSGNEVRLYFDEFITLDDIQNQLIVSPPLKYPPEILPQGGASKAIQITFKDTLRENTTYTLNFGQSIIDYNERNPNPFLTYVFSTGSYIDSLSLKGAVRDAFNRLADPFISVMLYELDSTYNDSTIYKRPPNYVTNTLDSTTNFEMKNLKAGRYMLVAVKDEGKNNLFDPDTDKVAFLRDTITLPTDTTYTLDLFRERPAYRALTPTYAAANRILFGLQGFDRKIHIEPLTPLPDSVRATVRELPGKDSLNFWFTPYETDSLVFRVVHENLNQIDTFTVKTRAMPTDSLSLRPSHSGSLPFEETLSLEASTPIVRTDSAQVAVYVQDSLPHPHQLLLDSLENRIRIPFKKEAGMRYRVQLLPGAVTDFFGQTNDTLELTLNTGNYADLGNLRFRLEGEPNFPMIVQLTNEQGAVLREQYLETNRMISFPNLQPGNFLIRLIEDQNGNGEWDTGKYLERRSPEPVTWYPNTIEVRANWEVEQTFRISKNGPGPGGI